MERLTEILSNGEAGVRGCGSNCKHDYRYCDNMGCCPTINEIIDKLAKYEDLEEQGLLLQLPCKIGDTVYVVPSAVNYKLNLINELSENNRIYEQTVSRIEILYTYGCALVTCNGLNCLMPEMRGETWFLTRKEAEAKLKELEEDSNAQKIITS